MKTVKVCIFGVGNRGNCYGELSINKPQKMKVVQIVDSNKTALEWAKNFYHLNDEDCFNSFDEWLNNHVKKADAVINCFMDQYHIETTMPLFKLGYDVLLEKPITNNPKELIALMDESKKYNRKLMVCHVLRYTPFYLRIKKIIESKELGDLVTIEMAEHVYLPHMMSSYVRGKWRSEKECGSPMIMAKCCHDTDLMCWFNNQATPVYVSSFGERTQFIPQNKPKDATEKCMDCPHKTTCQYSCYWYLLNTAQDAIVFNIFSELNHRSARKIKSNFPSNKAETCLIPSMIKVSLKAMVPPFSSETSLLMYSCLKDSSEEVVKNAIIALFNILGEEILYKILNDSTLPEHTMRQIREVIKEIEDCDNDEEFGTDDE